MGGMGGAFGGLISVVMVLILMRKSPPGPIGRLIAAGATSPETALKPQTAKIVRLHELDSALQRGLVVRLDDGRCWVDVPKVRRRRWVIIVTIAIAAGLVAEGVYLAARSLHLL